MIQHRPAPPPDIGGIVDRRPSRWEVCGYVAFVIAIIAIEFAGMYWKWK